MRRLAAAVAALALLAGCGSGTTEPSAPSASTVPIAQANGTIDYPVGAKRIVAQGYAIDNVLALGSSPSPSCSSPSRCPPRGSASCSRTCR